MSRKILIDLVSFKHNLSGIERLDSMLQVINSSKSKLLLFSGHSLKNFKDLQALQIGLINKKSYIIFELENIVPLIADSDVFKPKISNCLYTVVNGKVQSMYTNQLFTESNEINNNIELADRLLNELVTRRTIIINGLKILVLQCGELNILKNNQNDANSVQFRLEQNDSLLKRFDDLLNDTDVVLNPIHTPMGNQGKMEQRRIFLSDNNRYYFSVSNSKMNSDDLTLKSMQYAFHKGKPLESVGDTIESQNFIVSTFLIK